MVRAAIMKLFSRLVGPSWDVLVELCNDNVSQVPAVPPVQPLGSAWHGGGGDDCILICEHGAGEAKAGVEEPSNVELLVVIMLFVMLSCDQGPYCDDMVNRDCMSGCSSFNNFRISCLV